MTMKENMQDRDLVKLLLKTTNSRSNNDNFDITLSDLQGHSLQVFSNRIFRAVVWQDFNWHSASRGPSAIAEPLVGFVKHQKRLAVGLPRTVWRVCRRCFNVMDAMIPSLVTVIGEMLFNSCQSDATPEIVNCIMRC